MIKISSSIFLVVSVSTSLAFESGFYLGAEIGVSHTAYRGIPLKGKFQLISYQGIGIAPRFSLGYEFNSYFSTELGVIYMHQPHFDVINDNVKHSYEVKQNLVHLTGKLRWPMGKHVGLYERV